MPNNGDHFAVITTNDAARIPTLCNNNNYNNNIISDNDQCIQKIALQRFKLKYKIGPPLWQIGGRAGVRAGGPEGVRGAY